MERRSLDDLLDEGPYFIVGGHHRGATKERHSATATALSLGTSRSIRRSLGLTGMSWSRNFIGKVATEELSTVGRACGGGRLDANLERDRHRPAVAQMTRDGVLLCTAESRLGATYKRFGGVTMAIWTLSQVGTFMPATP